MTLEIIGAGLGRTGTLSLKFALEHIGFGPCYHAMEIPADEFRAIPLWSKALDGQPDWGAIFRGYRSTVDYPGCLFWPELMRHYPDAKIILTIRDADGWFDSMSATLFKPGRHDKGPMQALHRAMRRDLGDRVDDRAFVTDYFERWNQRIIDTVPPERLLVFAAKDGWEPLCRFLGVPIPDLPFPRANSRDELGGELRASPTSLAEVASQMRAYLNGLREAAFGAALPTKA